MSFLRKKTYLSPSSMEGIIWTNILVYTILPLRLRVNPFLCYKLKASPWMNCFIFISWDLRI